MFFRLPLIGDDFSHELSLRTFVPMIPILGICLQEICKWKAPVFPCYPDYIVSHLRILKSDHFDGDGEGPDYALPTVIRLEP